MRTNVVRVEQVRSLWRYIHLSSPMDLGEKNVNDTCQTRNRTKEVGPTSSLTLALPNFLFAHLFLVSLGQIQVELLHGPFSPYLFYWAGPVLEDLGGPSPRIVCTSQVGCPSRPRDARSCTRCIPIARSRWVDTSGSDRRGETPASF